MNHINSQRSSHTFNNYQVTTGTMVFTIQQITAFFEDADQMALSHRTRIQLQEEGINAVTDLSDFDDATLKQVSENLKRPGGTIDAQGAIVRTQPFVLGAKSLLRLKAATKLVKYYETVGRDINSLNMKWDPVMKTFIEHWQALVDRKEESTPDIPMITKNLAITKWSEAFMDFLHRVVGSRTIPLAYVVREDENVPAIAPNRATNQPYAEEFGSVEVELINRAKHNHALFRDDNSKVYYYLEEATRTTSFAASIKPFQRSKNGRGAFLALVSQYAGEDKWRAELKKQDDLLHNRKWKGNTNLSLDRFISQHRNAYVSMSQCAEHVPFQLPNALTRVTYLLDAIECNDHALQASIALVKNDDGPTGKLSDFEKTASFLLPNCPVSKKRNQSGTKRSFGATVSEIDAKTIRTGVGKATGVALRFHTKKEYAQLSKEEKDELREHRDSLQTQGKSRKLSTSGQKKSKGGSANSVSSANIEKMVASAIAKGLKDHAKAETDEADAEKSMKEYILSVVNQKGKVGGTQVASANATTSSTVGSSLIQSILKKAGEKGSGNSAKISK